MPKSAGAAADTEDPVQLDPTRIRRSLVKNKKNEISVASERRVPHIQLRLAANAGDRCK